MTFSNKRIILVTTCFPFVTFQMNEQPASVQPVDMTEMPWMHKPKPNEQPEEKQPVVK